MFCIKCGEKLPTGITICTNCGYENQKEEVKEKKKDNIINYKIGSIILGIYSLFMLSRILFISFIPFLLNFLYNDEREGFYLVFQGLLFDIIFALIIAILGLFLSVKYINKTKIGFFLNIVAIIILSLMICINIYLRLEVIL